MAKTIQYRVEVNTSRAKDDLNDLDNQLDDIQEKSKVDLVIENAGAVKSVADVRKAYKALRDAQIEVGEGTEEFTRLGEAAAQLKDKLDAVNEVSKDLGGSTFEKFKNSINRIREGIVNLDLDKVRQGFGQLGTTFKGLTSGLSTARIAAIGFGTALAATGIGAFVIAITTLVSQFDDLSKAGGLIGKIFTGINNVINGFKNSVLDLADAWGLVDKNQTKAAISAREAGANAKKAESLFLTNKAFESYYKNMAGPDPDKRTKFAFDLKAKQSTELNNFIAQQQELVKSGDITQKLYELRTKDFIDASRQSFTDAMDEYDEMVRKSIEEANKKREQDRKDAFNKRLQDIRLQGEIEKEDQDERLEFTEGIFDKEAQLYKDAEAKKQALIDKNKADTIEATNALIAEAERRIEAEKKLEEELTKFKEEQEQAKRQFIQETFNGTLNLTNAIGGLVSQLYANEIADAEGNFERQEELREESFEANKALQIASTVITTAQAVMNGLNAGLQIGGPWGIALGAVTAAAAAATGAVQIATIEATRYQPSGGSTPGITAPTPATPASIQPNVNFASTGTGFNQVGGGSNQFMNLSASISVSEINSVQNTVAVYESGSLIGQG